MEIKRKSHRRKRFFFLQIEVKWHRMRGPIKESQASVQPARRFYTKTKANKEHKLLAMCVESGNILCIYTYI